MYWRDMPWLVTWAPGFTRPRALGQLAHVAALKYSYTLPGGPASASFTLAQPPTWRTDALDPDRILRIGYGASWIWEGTLRDPAPGPDGWAVTADGAGTYGDDYLAEYTTWGANPPVDRAISRGLRWTNPGISAGLAYVKQPAANASQKITGHLNLLCTPGSATWYVGRGNVLRVFALPATVTRLLIVTAPAARRAEYINALAAYYQSSADSATKATYGLTWATNPASIARHQRSEDVWDMSASGQMSSGTAGTDAAAALAQYRAATYDGPFTVTYGQYLTTTGVAVNPATEQPGEVAKLLMTDGAYGGEVAPVPSPVFTVGATEYDAVAQTLTITPFGSARNDMSSLLSALGSMLGRAASPATRPANLDRRVVTR